MRASVLLVLAASCGTLDANNVPNRGDDDDAGTADAGTNPPPGGDDDDDDAVLDSGPTPSDTGTPPPTDTGTAPVVPCGNFPNVPLDNLSPGAGFTPTFMGLFVTAAVDSGTIEDYALWDVDAGAPIRDESSVLAFVFYDAAFTPLCTVTYDLSTVSSPASGWQFTAPVALWDAFDLTLNGAQTDCGTLGGNFGVNNAPALVESYQWNIGFGPMSAQMVNQLEPLITADGGSWVNDWDPYVFSMYVGTNVFGASEVQEFDYVFQLERTCENVVVDSQLYGTVTPVPNGALTGYVNAQAYLVVQFQ